MSTTRLSVLPNHHPQTVVDFEDRVVSRDPSRRVPFSSELTFTNSHTGT